MIIGYKKDISKPTLKDNLNASYATIGEATNMERSGVHRAVHNPWRTPLETYLKIAHAVGYPIDTATAEWKESQINKLKLTLDINEPCEYKELFRNIKILSEMTYPELVIKTGLAKSTIEGVIRDPAIRSWDTVKLVISAAELNPADYYKPWCSAIFTQKEETINAAIRKSERNRA